MTDSIKIHNQHKEKLNAFQALVLKWQKKINLVSSTTEKDFWNRHIEDSLQLAPFLEIQTPIWDFGSGAGFPGIVLSVLGYKVTLIESDARKAVFLSEAIRQLDLDASVCTMRVENINSTDFPENATITARAFAPLDKVLKLSEKLLPKNPTIILLKGEKIAEEMKEAEKHFRCEAMLYPSQTDARGKILILKNIQVKK